MIKHKSKKRLTDDEDELPVSPLPKIVLSSIPERYIVNGYVQVAAYLNEHGDSATKHSTTITAKQKQLAIDRIEWQRQYTYWLTRANNFANRMTEAGRSLTHSDKYKKLRTNFENWRSKLRDTFPRYNQTT